MSEFSLKGHDAIALNDLLKITGLCGSGGAAKVVIAKGKVKVDGQTEPRRLSCAKPARSATAKWWNTRENK